MNLTRSEAFIWPKQQITPENQILLDITHENIRILNTIQQLIKDTDELDKQIKEMEQLINRQMEQLHPSKYYGLNELTHEQLWMKDDARIQNKSFTWFSDYELNNKHKTIIHNKIGQSTKYQYIYQQVQQYLYELQIKLSQHTDQKQVELYLEGKVEDIMDVIIQLDEGKLTPAQYNSKIKQLRKYTYEVLSVKQTPTYAKQITVQVNTIFSYFKYKNINPLLNQSTSSLSTTENLLDIQTDTTTTNQNNQINRVNAQQLNNTVEDKNYVKNHSSDNLIPQQFIQQDNFTLDDFKI